MIPLSPKLQRLQAITFKEAAADYLASIRKTQTKKTLQRLEQLLTDVVLPVFGNVPLSDCLGVDFIEDMKHTPPGSSRDRQTAERAYRLIYDICAHHIKNLKH